MYLKVYNSGLSDPTTRRVIQFGKEELVVLPEREDSTRQLNTSEILAFNCPELYNQMLAKDINITVIVWKQDSNVSIAQRANQLESINSIQWSYHSPKIQQVSVEDHTDSSKRIVKLIGSSFGNFLNGPVKSMIDEML